MIYVHLYLGSRKGRPRHLRLVWRRIHMGGKHTHLLLHKEQVLISNLWLDNGDWLRLLDEIILQCWPEIWQSYSAEYVLPWPYQLFHLVGDFAPLKVQPALQLALFLVLKGCDATLLSLSDLSCVVSDIWSIIAIFEGLNHFQASTNRWNVLLFQ